MATSGVTIWELTQNEIITAALRKLGALGIDGTITTVERTNARQALNALLLTYTADGMQLWKRVTIPITLISSQQIYNLTAAAKLQQVIVKPVGATAQWPMTEKSYYDFNSLPTSTGGVPVHYYFQPKIQDGTLTIWPIPGTTEAAQYTLNAIIQKEFDTFTSDTLETPDFPAYWTEAIIYGLAVRLAPEYGIPLQDRQLLIQEAKMLKDQALAFDIEDGSLFFTADKRGWT